jgi:hypothetical protein
MKAANFFMPLSGVLSLLFLTVLDTDVVIGFACILRMGLQARALKIATVLGAAV